MAIDQVSISNEALAELPANTIQAFDENSLEASHCRQWYQTVLDQLLTVAQWKWATTRVALALVTNDREAEWPYCYQAPTGLKTMIRIWPYSASGSVYGPLVGQQLMVGAFFSGRLDTYPYEIVQDRIYTSAEQAMCDYVKGDGLEALMTLPFRQAFVLALASRICLPITKSRERRLELRQEAELALQRAIAHNENQQPEYYGVAVPELDTAWVSPLVTPTEQIYWRR